jgi:hypothetical protein
MARTPQYEKLLAELAAGELKELERQILTALQKAPGGLTRQGLIRVVFGVEPQRNLGNDPHDRKIRKAIESLRDKLFPIVYSSGEPGYRLDTSPEAIENMVAELESRVAHLQQKADVARQFYHLPIRMEKP